LAADDVNPFWASRPADRCDHRQQPMAEQLRPDGQGLVRPREICSACLMALPRMSQKHATLRDLIAALERAGLESLAYLD